MDTQHKSSQIILYLHWPHADPLCCSREIQIWVWVAQGYTEPVWVNFDDQLPMTSLVLGSYEQGECICSLCLSKQKKRGKLWI